MFIDKVILLVILDSKLLMVREKGKTVPFLLGGTREQGETDHDVLVREVREEIGCDIVPSSVTPFLVFQTPAVGKVDTVVKGACYFGELQGLPQPSSEIEEICWISYEQRPQDNPLACSVFDALRENSYL